MTSSDIYIALSNCMTRQGWYSSWWQRGKPTRAHRDYGLMGYIYLVIYCHVASYGPRSQKTGVYMWRGWVIPLRLLWQLEHLRCKQTALHGGGDALFGNRGTGQPVFAETLRVDDVLPRLHSHVLANLACVARWQLRCFTFFGTPALWASLLAFLFKISIVIFKKMEI